MYTLTFVKWADIAPMRNVPDSRHAPPKEVATRRCLVLARARLLQTFSCEPRARIDRAAGVSRKKFSSFFRENALLIFIAVLAPALNSFAARAQEIPAQRIPRQTAQKTAALDGIVRSRTPQNPSRGIGGAMITLRNIGGGASGQIRQTKIFQTTTNGEGVFRMLAIAPGRYELSVEAPGFEPFQQPEITLAANELVTLEIALEAATTTSPETSRLPRQPELGPTATPETAAALPPYRELRRRLDSDPQFVVDPISQSLPASSEVFSEMPDRWNVAMPEWRRYGRSGEYPYVKGHRWDPFNRNRLKGDEPIWPAHLGRQTFFNLTATSNTFFDGRRLPTPSNVSAARPGSREFFGKGEQIFLDQTFRFSLDLFHGDTSFQPVNWRVRVTPEVSLNDLATRELGVVSPDVRAGRTRLDSHVGLQEAFVEYKLKDLSVNYDFISVRAGIQQFSSDFRGFLFVDEQPGVRLFGNLRSNRWEYNLAYFHLLEKNTNSGLNKFERRRQQVIVANLYWQDFFFPGYTMQFSVHYNKDDATRHYDDNGFLVRPAPVGSVREHNVRAAYLGWTGQGHIRRVNLSHAFYQALGSDDFNPLAGRAVTINAQMAAAEISVDKDWTRWKVSAFYASGDGDPRNARARGFDAIEDLPSFAGGIFSLWNREGIRLSGSGILLTAPNSLLPSLRASKEEGQANFVNPGILLINAGADFDLTPKLKSVVNVNYLRFERTEPLELLLFQAPIRHSIGFDYSVGVQYRPPLTENITVTGGVSALTPGQGFKDIYTGKTLFSVFTAVRFQF